VRPKDEPATGIEQEDNPMNPEAKQTIKHLQEKLLELKEYL